MKRELTLADIAGYLPHKLQIQSQLGNPHAGLEALAEAGALIAAEIDRLNTLAK